MITRETTAEELPRVLRVQQLAFGQEEESILVENLLTDESARPLTSLLAEDNGLIIGHALFTHVALGNSNTEIKAALLAPLAVVPTAQRAGVGRALIEKGCHLLANRGVTLLFVLGDPAYYTRCGFSSASPHGLRAPYPISPDDAWMVRSTNRGKAVPHIDAEVVCAVALRQEKYWRE